MVEFERLVQGRMSVSSMKRIFLELSEFCPYLISGDDKKKIRFIDGRNDVILSCIFGAPHPTFQSLRDVVFVVSAPKLNN